MLEAKLPEGRYCFSNGVNRCFQKVGVLLVIEKTLNGIRKRYKMEDAVEGGRHGGYSGTKTTQTVSQAAFLSRANLAG